MKNIIVILIHLYSLAVFGQETNIKAKIFEIESYTRLIDSTETDYSESYTEGSKFYSKAFKKYGEWEVYILHKIRKGKEDNFPWRIKYIFAHNTISENLNLYYKNDKLVFADLTLTVYKKKRKVGQSMKKLFYFSEDKLIYESENKDKSYSLQFLLNQVDEIKKLIHQ